MWLPETKRLNIFNVFNRRLDIYNGHGSAYCSRIRRDLHRPTRSRNWSLALCKLCNRARSNFSSLQKTWRNFTKITAKYFWKRRITSLRWKVLYYPRYVESLFPFPVGNYTRRAIFPAICKINQSIKRRLLLQIFRSIDWLIAWLTMS